MKDTHINSLALIPARLASKRFPEKLLYKINGKSILEHVYQQVSKCSFVNSVGIIADDTKLVKEAHKINASCIQSTGEFSCGTDRIFNAYQNFDDFDLLINVQADQPFIDPQIIDILIKHMEEHPEVNIASLMSKSPCHSDSLKDVKVVVDKDNFAIEFLRLAPLNKIAFHHIGVYGFRKNVIEKLRILKPSKNEIALNLEQLRWLDNGYSIMMIPVNYIPVSVNVPEDIILLKMENESY